MTPALKKCPGVNHQKRIPNRTKFQEASFKRYTVLTRYKVVKAHGKVTPHQSLLTMPIKTMIRYHLTRGTVAITEKIYKE